MFLYEIKTKQVVLKFMLKNLELRNCFKQYIKFPLCNKIKQFTFTKRAYFLLLALKKSF